MTQPDKKEQKKKNKEFLSKEIPHNMPRALICCMYYQQKAEGW